MKLGLILGFLTSTGLPTLSIFLVEIGSTRMDRLYHWESFSSKNYPPYLGLGKKRSPIENEQVLPTKDSTLDKFWKNFDSKLAGFEMGFLSGVSTCFPFLVLVPIQESSDCYCHHLPYTG